jgi:hypothetical protein
MLLYIYPPLSLFLYLLHIFEGVNLRGSPRRLRNGPSCGGSPDNENATIEARDWEMALECFAPASYSVQTSQKTPTNVAVASCTYALATL